MRTASPPPRPMTSSAAAATAGQWPRRGGRAAAGSPPSIPASTRSVKPGGGSFRRSAALSSLSIGFLQLAPQRLQGAVELTLDRVDAQPDDAADFVRAELFLIA